MIHAGSKGSYTATKDVATKGLYLFHLNKKMQITYPIDVNIPGQKFFFISLNLCLTRLIPPPKKKKKKKKRERN
jgi:hypothetical protein